MQVKTFPLELVTNWSHACAHTHTHTTAVAKKGHPAVMFRPVSIHTPEVCILHDKREIYMLVRVIA